MINGGAGTDTLKISFNDAGTAAVALPNVSNVEIIEVQATQAFTLDTSNTSGVTNVNVTKATLTTGLKAAATTDVSVSGAAGAIDVEGGKNIVVTDAAANNAIQIGESGAGTANAAGTITVTDTKQGTADIEIDGGTDVTVTTTVAVDNNAAVAGGDVIIGANKAASGAVVVTQNLNSDGGDGNADDLTAANIAITGGSTVNVTVNANLTAKDKNAEGDITVGTVTVTGDGSTTDVTVKQNATSTKFTTAAVAEVVATQSVTFKDLAKDATVTVNGLIFTASKALTAAEVAQAFANLTKDDLQEAGGKVANGVYTGQFNNVSGWTSGAANGATVVFTAPAHNSVAITTASSAVASAPTAAPIVAGKAASAEVNTTNDITKGAVNVVDTAATDAITTVSIDGFNGAAIGVDATPSAVSQLTKLTTLTLANNTKDDVIEVGTTATALTLNVNNIQSSGTTYINLDNDGNGVKDTNNATVTNLTVNATGKASSFELVAGALENLTIAAAVGLDISDTAASYATANLETVSISGAGAVKLGDISGATALNSFNASGNTGGVTATIEADAGTLTGDIEEYVFSEGNDTVTVEVGSGTAADVKVSTGAGNDKVTLTGISTAGAMIDGGTGTNTLAMTAANAVTASATDAFEAKISNFQKLSITDTPTTIGTVNLANMDDINYVISANSGTSPAVAEVQTFTINSGTSAAVAERQTIDFVTNNVSTGAGDITVGGITVTLAGTESNAQIATAVAAAINGQSLTNPNTGTGTVTATAAFGVVTVIFPADANYGDIVVANVNAGITNLPVVTQTVAYDSNAGNITIEGVNVAVTAGLTADQVGALIAAADYSATTIASVTYNTTTDTVTVTYDAGVDELDTTTVDTDSTGVTFGTVATTTNGAAAGTTPALTLNNMADNGTVELTAAGAGVNVTVKDAGAAGATNNSLNVVISDALTAAGINVGAVVVDDVETVNVTANDTVQDANEDGKDDTNAAHTAAINGDAIKTINVAGAGDVTITTNSAVLEAVNAASLTGKLTYNATVADVVVTGGSAADALTVTADGVKVNAGEGNDVIAVAAGADLAVIDGGAGNDTFDINGAASNKDSYAVFNNVASGDVFDFAAFTVGKFVAAKVTLATGATESTQAYLNQAVTNLAADEMGWFQYGGNTFVVIDKDGNGGAADLTTFEDGTDVVIMIAGLKDLSTGASFNNTNDTLEII